MLVLLDRDTRRQILHILESLPGLDLAGERVFFCGSGCRDAYAAQHA